MDFHDDVEAYRSLRSLKRWESFVFWLYRIASMRCKMWMRSQSRRIDQDFIMVGPERTLINMMTEPDWVKDMFVTDAQVCVDMAEEMMERGMEFDAGWIFDDLGFRDHSFLKIRRKK